METAHFGVFEPGRPPMRATADEQKPFFSDPVPLTDEERHEAILSGKLPPQEQDHGRQVEVSLANWLALMHF